MLPLIKNKEKNYLYFYIPVFIVTMVINIVIGLGVPYVSITSILEGFINNLFKVEF